MTVQERVPLHTLTTLKVGGTARFVLICENVEDVRDAVVFANERTLPLRALGEGSNVLAADSGFEGVILLMRLPNFEFLLEEGGVHAVAEAGVSWDELVSAAVERDLWGIENLAGIPGTVGAAPVQNIGAYGTELADTLLWVEAFDTETMRVQRFAAHECALGYRDSRFKRESNLLIVRVALLLKAQGNPRVSYSDLVAAQRRGVALDTPRAIAAAVREIRSRKFPDLREYGTAGSFFKNPIISRSAYATLKKRYPDLPGFTTDAGIKIPLAWILDNVLHLRGFTQGSVRLFEKQPLVLVADKGAMAYEVNALAHNVEARVHTATGITIEREVRSLPS